MTQPTAQDLRNAATRAEIAAAFQRDYDQCAAWAEALFGPGFVPSHRWYLLDKDDEASCRHTGERPMPAATVYAARNAEKGEARHFILRAGKPVEVAGYESGFGDMLFESHPTRRVEVQGESVATHRYSLCWDGYTTYTPRTADQLAEARVKRERKAVERLAKANPLFADQIRSGELKPDARHP